MARARGTSRPERDEATPRAGSRRPLQLEYPSSPPRSPARRSRRYGNPSRIVIPAGHWPSRLPPKTRRSEFEWEEFAPSRGIEVMFSPPDRTEVYIIFKERPLGLELSVDLPLRVKGVVPGGHSDHLGVQPDWVFRKIDYQRISGEESYEEVLERLQPLLVHLKPRT
eukprot:NODE_20123_length_812_cov_3.332847.p1 GENE.NODE_20123_length_812_cov_3.332847~~NODE_20123_length_812_cov_3.332847.p1  ORF type:complete len:167 (-),score=26.51 NODE_20123_length_812_cov_3.332847:166-666(-)